MYVFIKLIGVKIEKHYPGGGYGHCGPGGGGCCGGCSRGGAAGRHLR